MTGIIPASIPLHNGHGDAASAAAYMAWIAYPAEGEATKRDHFFRCVCVGHFKTLGNHPPDEWRGIKRRDADAAIRRGMHRITTRRIPAALMALRQVGIDPVTGKMGLRKSILRFVEAAGEYSDQHFDPDNVKKDVWRESRSSLAMTIALPLSLGNKPERQVQPIQLLTNGAWVPAAMVDAARIAPIILGRVAPAHINFPVALKIDQFLIPPRPKA